MVSSITDSCLEALRANRGKCTLIANVLTLTAQMVDAARSGDWTRVVAMENERSQLVKQCFSEPVGAENSEIFSEALAIMLHMNEEVVALLNAAKVYASVKHVDNLKKHEAIAHYLDID